MSSGVFDSGDPECDRAHQAWIILVGYVKFGLDMDTFGKGVITYKRLGCLMGFPEAVAGRQAIAPVRYIFRFCEANGLPLLSAMVVRKDTGLPGWDYAVPNEQALRRLQAEVLQYDWFQVRPPLPSIFKLYP